jgi:hypothetical protein
VRVERSASMIRRISAYPREAGVLRVDLEVAR